MEQQDGLQDQKHRQEQKPQQHSSNIKFTAMADSTDGLIMARFGDVNLYLQLGLVGLVGRPDHRDILKAMEAEHRSNIPFHPGNYPGQRRPNEEFEFVFSPKAGKVYPHEKVGGAEVGRERKLLEELMQLPEIIEAKVTIEELGALRMYTGAMFAEYNTELRNALTDYLKRKAKDFLMRKANGEKVEVEELFHVAASLAVDLQKIFRGKLTEKEKVEGLVEELSKLVANLSADSPRFRYVTTIHMANSCIIKLASVLQCPKDRKVFRGLSRIILPYFVYIANKRGFRGGVEPGFMSATTTRSVAVSYSVRGRMPIVLELQVGQVHCGADVQNISQYPTECEVTLPPLTHIEILDDGRVQEVDGMQVLVLSGKLSVNIKSLNREQLVSLRKDLLVSTLENQVYEVQDSMQEKLQEFVKRKGLKDTHYLVEEGRQVVSLLVNECKRTEQRLRTTSPEEFNNSEHLHNLALQEIAALACGAAAKFSAFSETQSINKGNFDLMSMEQWAALRVNEKWHVYQEAARLWQEAGASKADDTLLRQAALDLAVERGLVSVHRDAVAMERMQNSGVRHLDAISGSDNNTALIRAVARTHISDVRLLLDAGCSMDAGDAKGCTPLAYSMIFGLKDIAQELLKRGASVRALTERGESLLFLASRFGHVKLVDTIRTHLEQHPLPDGRTFHSMLMQTEPQNNHSCLWVAAHQGHDAMVSLLLKAGGRDLLFCKSTDGKSCLHAAAESGHAKVAEVSALIECRGDKST